MTFAFGAKSLSFCTRVDPRMMAVAKLAITLTEQDFGFTAEQSRTVAEEAALMAKGFSHTMHSHHLINDGSLTWEKTPSATGFSGAIDAVAWDGTKFVWEWPRQYVIAAAFKAASIRLNTPITWGGCWGKLMSEIPGDDAAAMHAVQNGFDGPHFELGRN